MTATRPMLRILYRGPLASCNYGCPYCPFAKRRDDRAALDRDRAALDRFVAWVEAQADGPRDIGILFTPWGEALVRRHYRDAMLRLSRLPHVARVAVQTNGSHRFDWALDGDRRSLGFWITWHPGEVAMDRFLDRIAPLVDHGIRHSVGVVGLHEHRAAIEALRGRLSTETYLWINAYKRIEGYDDAASLAAWTAIDPLFALNATRHDSLGQPCHAGETAISVDGEGTVRRCHFVPQPLGNLYSDSLDTMLRPRACPNTNCGCHIGYVHLKRLDLYRRFGAGVLERIPETTE